jgi:DNA repair exonuclease SbcCD ATPase subunit
LEGNANQLGAKKEALKQINTKVTIAEEGHLKEIVADKNKLSNEVSLAASLEQIQKDYELGLTLTILERDYDECAEEAAPLTGLPGSTAALAKIKAVIEGANDFLKQKGLEINSRLKADAVKIATALAELKAGQKQLETQINAKITVLQQKGLTGNLSELTTLLNKKSGLTQEITQINGQSAQLKKLRADRKRYLAELETTRQEIAARRKAQLSSINTNLGTTIKDYTVFLHYDPNGITEEFRNYILNKMHGTYFQEETAEKFCASITPPELAALVLARDYAGIASQGGISLERATELGGKLYFFKSLHELEIMWKPPCPLITAKTKAAKPKEIPVNQLSDGQKHTIMLTIAMLAESNIPLIIDQPEDDLDHAFIFSAVVKVLRTIKERRQVILVTHNANIAVLGDAELLLPMQRKGEGGGAFDRGSIDKTGTKKVVLNILEGGRVAFERRREIYGH